MIPRSGNCDFWPAEWITNDSSCQTPPASLRVGVPVHLEREKDNEVDRAGKILASSKVREGKWAMANCLCIRLFCQRAAQAADFSPKTQLLGRTCSSSAWRGGLHTINQAGAKQPGPSTTSRVRPAAAEGPGDRSNTSEVSNAGSLEVWPRCTHSPCWYAATYRSVCTSASQLLNRLLL